MLRKFVAIVGAIVVIVVAFRPIWSADRQSAAAPTAPAVATAAAKAKSVPPILGGDYTEWGSTTYKNNVRQGVNIPEFNVGFDEDGKRAPQLTKNVKWRAKLGSQTYGNPIISKGKVLIGTNNAAGWLKRYPAEVDLGVMLCFRESDGGFLWQYSAEKLHTGRAQDWEELGLCSTPVVEGDRAWFVDNRCELVCVDLEGFLDNEDDGPVTGEWAHLADIRKGEDPAKDPLAPAVAALKDGQVPQIVRSELAKLSITLPAAITVTAGKQPNSWSFDTVEDGVKRTYSLRAEGPKLVVNRLITTDDKQEADVIWRLDMIKQLGASPHNASSCSPLIVGDLMFVSTSNGVDAQHNNVPAPDAPTLVCVDKHTGKVYWTDNSPGPNILHGQWSSPAYAVIDGVPQVIYPCGDGWLRSFEAVKTPDGKPKLLWKFDCNPKVSLYEIKGGGDRNHIIATPVIYDNKVYVAVGEDPEHGDGIGHLWCVDPTKRGDISAELAFHRSELSKPLAERKPLPWRRLQAVQMEAGEIAIPNPNSGVVWHYHKQDADGNGEIDEALETMHRSLSTVAIADDILYIADFSGIVHCLDAQSGKLLWTYDMLSACWGSPLVCDGKMYIGDEDGNVSIFKHGRKQEFLGKVFMGSSVLGTPIVANNVLYIFNKNTLYAIAEGK